MTDTNARALVPVWASQDEPTPPPRQTPPRFNPQDWFHDFKIKNGIGMILLFAWAASMMIGCIATGMIVHHNTTQRVTKQVKSDTEGEMRAGFAKWCSDHNIDPQTGEKIEKLLVDEESKQAQITALSKLFAEHIASLRMDRHVTKDGAITYIWGVDIPRAESGRYGDMQSVLDGSVEGYVKGHPTRPEDDALGLEIATDYISGKRPDRWRPDLEFAVINADGSVTARNEHITGPSTAYWWYGM